jgi:hypothetical protein
MVVVSKLKLLYDWRSVSKSVYLGVEHPCGTCDRILLLVGMLLSENCGLISVGRPLWREDGSAICSAITQWSESRRTRNHTLLPHLRLLQLRGPGSRIYMPWEQGGPIIPLGTGLSYDSQGYGGGILTLLLPGWTGPRIYLSQEWNGPVQSKAPGQMSKSKSKFEVWGHVTTDGQSVSQSVNMSSLWPSSSCSVHEQKTFLCKASALEANIVPPLNALQLVILLYGNCSIWSTNYFFLLLFILALP